MASNEGFLTEGQREMLKFAPPSVDVLSSSPKSPTLKSPGAAAKSASVLLTEHLVKAPGGGKASTAGIAMRHVRRTHSGKHIRVKKDGAGGKGTWGRWLDTDGESHIDKNDPNYDSGEEPYELVGTAVSDPLDDYKKSVASIIEEYFSTGDVEVATSDLKELGSAEYHPYFIKRLVSMSMDRHDKEKEMASVLLSALYADVINPTQISQGFFMLVESADDLAVDIPDTVDILALFIARAVVDDILPPAFIARARKMLPESSKGIQVLQTAEKSYLSAPHHAELVERRWGGSTHFTVEEVKKRIADLLREYVESGDTAEACRCIRKLEVSFFYHEVVKRALVLAMEMQSAEPLILKLLKEAAEEGLISSSQMVKGFSRMAESIDDLSLDIPSAKMSFQSIVPRAISEGWLDATSLKASGEDGPANGPDDEKVKQYKKQIVNIIHEYFLSDDIPELIRSLEDLVAPEYNPIFLKKLITLAMDRKNKEKEMASVLLSALHIEIFSTEDIVNGFVMLLESADMDVKVISKESIKPCIPTPQHLRNYKISFIDQFTPCSYIPVILFYNANDDVDHELKPMQVALAETLSYYYPLAGRFKDVYSIECNDEGVVYVEAQANFNLSKFLQNPDIPFLNKFLPFKGNCLEPSYNQPLVALQTTTFECGGMAIGVCMLHKVVDASTMSVFLKTWAKISRGEGDKTLHPDFTSAISLFPPIDSLPTKFITDFDNFYFQGSKSPMRRFLFDSKSIKALKANTSSESVPFPSKIEALTAFICKRIGAALIANNVPKTLMITHAANLRSRVEPPLPQKTFGNLLWLAFAFYDPLDTNNELPDLGIMLREVFAQLTAENIKDIDSECVFESLSEVLESLSTNENIKTYRFTSWCNMGLYDVNFGWGKPVWVAHMGDLLVANVRSKQQFVFIESASRQGIELWVASDEEEIRFLEKDAEFLAYANPNPSICIN